MVSNSASRGGVWVAIQFLLMVAGLSAGILWPAQWQGLWSFAVGGALLVVADWAGIRGKRDLGRNRTPFPRPKDDGELVTTGIYGRIRHPLYLAVVTLGFAWAFLWRSYPALAVALLQLPFFDAKARREERWLRNRFPAYSEYAARVKRFVPGVY